MNIHKFAPRLFTHSLSHALQFYVEETAWFAMEINFGMNCVRLKFNFHPNLFLELHEKIDYDYLVMLKPTLNFYIDDLDAELARLKQVHFTSGAKLELFQGQEIFEYPAGRFFTFSDPTGNQLQFLDNRYM